MKFFTLSIITGLVLWPIIGSAELYKWTDEQGNLHVTDAPPRELQKKKAGPALKPRSQSAQPMKATPSFPRPERSRADVSPLPESSITVDSVEDAAHLNMVGLTPQQATLTSAWQTFDGTRSIAKAPVQRWKDQRGIDHFADVLPMATSSAELGTTSGKPRLKTR
ncbi:MAG: hypothetical protein CV090_05875 [Nitrospira sp. WS238]|nr:hypothetical protein [Nitrospira sp. WS238]